jgi:hypothetical protein
MDMPKPDVWRYDVPAITRNRILQCVRTFCNSGRGDLGGIVQHIYDQCQAKFGGLYYAKRSPPRNISEAVQAHWDECDDDKFICTVEFIFQSQYYGGEQYCVDEINGILREEGVGYEFSRYLIVKEPNRVYVAAFPEATRKSNELMHSTTVMPALHLLGGGVWAAANAEMVKAHEHLRNSNYPDAIHWAGKCLESVLQIICDKKNWKFTPDKDTLNPLLQTCKANGLFAAPYIDILQKSSGEIRNKWGGHGKAKSAHGEATLEMAEHMIQITSAHVLLLAKMAGIP